MERFERFTIVALSDGHGSASCPFSDEGSQAAVDTVYEVFKSIFEETDDPYDTIEKNKDTWLPKQIERHWKTAVHELHADKDVDFTYELYGATLLALVAADDFIFALQLGDGDILSVQTGEVEWFLPPSDSLGPETNSLCQENCWKFMQTKLVRLGGKESGKKPPMFFMSTDGYANSFSTGDGFKQAGADFYALLREKGREYIKENICGWLQESSAQGSGDDITVGIICCRNL